MATASVPVTGRRIDEDDEGLNIICTVEDVDERHRAQAAYQETLESRVAEHTAELASANQHLKAEIIERQKAEIRIWHVAKPLPAADTKQFLADRTRRWLRKES
jgi:hypothetical protein